MWKVGDQVWVKTGISSAHEELATVTKLPTNDDSPPKKKSKKSTTKSKATTANSNITDRNGNSNLPQEIVVKYTVAGYEATVSSNKIRHMESLDINDNNMDGRGRKVRRSGRSSGNNTSVLMNVGSAAATVGSGVGGSGAGDIAAATTNTAKKKFTKNAASAITPSPTSTELDTTCSSSSGGDDIVMEDSKPSAAAASKKRKSISVSKDGASNKKKVKSNGEKKKGTSPYFAKDDKVGKSSTAVKGKNKKAGKGRKLLLASSEEDDTEMTKEERWVKNEAARRKTNNKGGAIAERERAFGKDGKRRVRMAAAAAAAKSTAKGGERKEEPESKKGKTQTAAAAALSYADSFCVPCNDEEQPPIDKKKKAPRKKKAAKGTASSSAASSSNNNNNAPDQAQEGNQPDGNGGLNQQLPWIVEYSKTGRATCRSCDEKILKGEVRVGHTPLFRGKPGFMVYRHLHCATFSEDIVVAEDVENYSTLNEEDYEKLVQQVEISKERIIEERKELRPDELVQKNFTGEIRSEPKGLVATLLPFQVEGFSWMRHQEVMEPEIRGGILADEMGMGKTLQTIATILDHRPKLQHAKPGMKYPPEASDLKERQEEEQLWDKAKVDWAKEMELLKVPKKLQSRDGGARAGTLVICPVIALTQWKTEIEKFTENGTLSVCTYHGPDRESQTPRKLMQKYDVVLTTYQVLEADFRKMTSPNRVECPNCGGKFKIDKLPIHLKYFCGDNAERTEAQSRQRRGSNHGGGGGVNARRGRGRGPGSSNNKKSGDKKDTKKKTFTKDESEEDDDKKMPAKKVPAKKPAKKKPAQKKGGKKKSAPSKTEVEEEISTTSPRSGSGRSAARKAASQISQSAAEWMPPDDDDDSDNFKSEDESSSDDDSSDSEDGYSSDSSSSSDDSALERAREKQRQALEMAAKNKKKPAAKKKQPVSKAKGKKVTNKKKSAAKGKGKKKKFDDEPSDDDYSSDDDGSDSDDIDMQALIDQAMAGAKNSVLHSICWWRIVLDEAHFIKTRSSQTANAAFSLIGVNRWCLSGTPLQNRVGEFYSLVRFLRLNPMAYYYCRAKGCDCASMHYQIHAGICQGCGHGGIQHYSHFNKYILNPIQRDGYSGDGRKAMFLLKNEVLDKALLRRTKETKAADMELPPRLVQIKPVRLHPVEEDFYSALYTQTKSSFDDYVDSGTLLNNYAHIFDLLIRMRQSVDHPYLVIHSKKNTEARARSMESTNLEIANGSADCDLCHEPPTDRVLSTCCGAAYCRSCVLEYMATSNSMAASASLSCPSCRGAFSIDLQASADIEDDAALAISSSSKESIGSSLGMPSLKELPHVATGSILRRINLADFATSSKIEALTRELVMMRQTSPGSKAIVFSQFVNMLDLIRWRLHSDPYLEDIGLGCKALHGGMNVKARDATLKAFREDNNCRVLLMSLKAGGVALNLTCANYIYLMDPWWNPAAEMQAIDRTHRLGQYRPIRAVRFIAENTVEERILQLQEKKRLVFDGTVGRDARSLKMLTVDDMKSLFA